MSELSGSLVGIGTPAILHFLAGLEKSGRLYIWDGPWAGEVFLDSGRVSGATFDAERGLDALEAIVLSLPQAQFAFETGATTPPPGCALPAVPPSADGLVARLARLEADYAGLAPGIPLLAAVPRPVDGQFAVAGVAESLGEPAAAAAQALSLDRRALQVCLAVDGRRTVAELAAGYGVARTARLLRTLVESGVLELAAPSQWEEPPAAVGALAEGMNVEAPATTVAAATPSPPQATGESLRYWLRPLVLAALTLILLALTRWQAG